MTEVRSTEVNIYLRWRRWWWRNGDGGFGDIGDDGFDSLS